MIDSLSDSQRKDIDDIVSAVSAGRHWRVGVLLERFVEGADLPSLMALRQALAEEVARQGPR